MMIKLKLLDTKKEQEDVKEWLVHFELEIPMGLSLKLEVV